MDRDELIQRIDEASQGNTLAFDLSSNQISQLPPEIAKLQSLTDLYLSNNQLSELPPEFTQLQSLVTLFLNHNQLSQLPPEIAKLQSLTDLDLSSNQLSQLPPEIVQLKSLRTLNMSGNPALPISEEFLELLKDSPTFLIGYYFDEIVPSQSQLRRSIEFPPEYREAGISILSYFNQILNTKYPDMEIGVTIEQKGTLVTLIIDTPDGQQETIERELIQYGLVVTDKLPPEEYLSDPMEALRLKQELDMAKMRIQHTKELLYTEREQFAARIGNLEDQTKFLENMLSNEQSAKIELIHALTQLTSEASEANRQALNAIIEIVKRGATESDETTLAKDMETIKKSNPAFYDKLKSSVLTALTQVTTSEAAKAIIGSLS